MQNLKETFYYQKIYTIWRATESFIVSRFFQFTGNWCFYQPILQIVSNPKSNSNQYVSLYYIWIQTTDVEQMHYLIIIIYSVDCIDKTDVKNLIFKNIFLNFSFYKFTIG